ncbi:transketolase [Sanguibacter antarcticus]|uniref:Transketolase n=1 Tax=Sanguibacter antarcticus TaxID=372484 RepID=A0A2A9E9F2_9MICO|nr:transketolase [Sanguibacter antarcticus]PFG34810.1 transketolase [Sanguibacter antarcticus]
MTAPVTTSLDERAVTAARVLALDAIEAAKSGHPGAALALAPVADLLFQKHIRHDPHDPSWAGRDRFVLSCGHASMLLYTQLFLTGYDLSLDDIASFRTLHSRTPGHPELGMTPGVDATTGPLGQGITMAVGMAMAFQRERAVYDPEGLIGSPFDRHVWVLASDGDLQEGISYEAGALAGRHQLDNLTVVYDDNDIQIEGSTTLTWSEDVGARFAAQGWRVSRVSRAVSGDIDVPALDTVLSSRTDDGRPHLVVLKSEIAWPAPNARGTAASHGAPLGTSEVSEVRAALGVTTGPFELDPEAVAHTRRAVARGARLHTEWDQRMSAWAAAHPDLDTQWRTAQARELPDDLAASLPVFEVGSVLATRDASGQVIQALAARLPDLVGGSADLAEPNRTAIAGSHSFLPEGEGRTGRNIHWGVREHAMAAAMNGMLLAGGTRPFGGTFLVFSDYQRPAIRLAALMGLPAIYVWSHDSIALGQDGPTHQPIEHLTSLRAMPGLTTIRPADANETAAAWLVALEQDGPTGLVLCRQPLRTLDLPLEQVTEGVRRGAYVVSDDADADAVVIATGSELELAVEAAERVRAAGTRVRVVSMPSRELFERQDAGYRESVLPAALTARVVVEAASTYGWRDIAGDRGVLVGIDQFGLSAPAGDAQHELGMTVDRVVQAIETAMVGKR